MDERTIQFARHNFDNHQALIRSSDTKAGVMVTIAVFLAASAMQVSKDAVSKLAWSPCSHLLSSLAFVVGSLGLFVSVLWALVTVLRVLKPRGARHTKAEKGKDLLWQDHVLLHGSNAEYYTAVSSASDELILKNLTDQIFELAHISKEKMDALQSARWVNWLAFWSWIANVVAGLILLRY